MRVHARTHACTQGVITLNLKKIELHGFKSFADKTEIPFESNVTGIVGPNGCGKSNVIDAVRWVLGEQAPKTLRVTKMPDLIFNGTTNRLSLSYCEVSLYLDNEDRRYNVDFDEVVITRKLVRGGEGEYFINRQPCRLKDIIDLFRDTGIGKEGYSIIGQGKIDQVLMVDVRSLKKLQVLAVIRLVKLKRKENLSALVKICRVSTIFLPK